MTPAMTHLDQTQAVLQRCRDLGFALAGIARAERSTWTSELRDWLGHGMHGEMTYMARHLDVRSDPRELLPGAESVICVADRYSRGERDRIASEPRGRIARYARGDDYHKVMKKRLRTLCDELSLRFPTERFRACVDTAPLLEREFAAVAGLGAIGKNTMLIEPGAGSYLLLGEVVTTLDLQPTDSTRDVDPCGSCTRCIEACPTDAISPWRVDATRCISYLTIEHRSLIDEALHEEIGDWIFGCDICQEVCPHNQPTRRSRSADIHSAYQARHADFDLLDVLNWDEQDRRDAFLRSSMKRAKLAMMKRNALIAVGNWLRTDSQVRESAGSQGAALRARLEEIARDAREEVVVRETAAAVLRRICGSDVR